MPQKTAKRHPRKRGLPDWDLVFTTALTVDECRQLILQETMCFGPHWQRVDMHDDGSFMVEMRAAPPPVLRLYREAPLEIRFNGILEAQDSGTSLRGKIAYTTAARYQAELNARRFWFRLSVMLVILTAILSLLLHQMVPLVLALIGASVAVLLTEWRWRHILRFPPQLVDYVRERLYKESL
jgi:hypothetical protein